jgi:hypothetical protein
LSWGWKIRLWWKLQGRTCEEFSQA